MGAPNLTRNTSSNVFHPNGLACDSLGGGFRPAKEHQERYPFSHQLIGKCTRAAHEGSLCPVPGNVPYIKSLSRT